jgi:hypothetical protein
MVGREIRKVSRGYHYFFVKPRANANVHRTVEKLMKIGDVKEVAITEGEYGFVVKAQESHDEEQKTLGRISKAVGGTAVKAVCHCQYVRR